MDNTPRPPENASPDTHSPEKKAFHQGGQAPEQAADISKNYAHIKGWGIDADPRNDPTYPIKKRNNAEHAGYSWERPAQQPVNIEVLHSVERPNITAVFGTATPPSGLSGALRRSAFRRSENDYSHWMPLVFADRIDMMEGFAGDLARGHLPNLYKEGGLRADWQHDRQALLAKAVLGIGLGALAVMYFRQKRSPRLADHAFGG